MHNPEAPHRNKYPEDYDSTSDYEVRKIGEVIKHIDDHRRQLENVKKSITEVNKDVSAQVKTLETSTSKTFEDVRNRHAEMSK